MPRAFKLKMFYNVLSNVVVIGAVGATLLPVRTGGYGGLLGGSGGLLGGSGGLLGGSGGLLGGSGGLLGGSGGLLGGSAGLLGGTGGLLGGTGGSLGVGTSASLGASPGLLGTTGGLLGPTTSGLVGATPGLVGTAVGTTSGLVGTAVGTTSGLVGTAVGTTSGLVGTTSGLVGNTVGTTAGLVGTVPSVTSGTSAALGTSASVLGSSSAPSSGLVTTWDKCTVDQTAHGFVQSTVSGRVICHACVEVNQLIVAGVCLCIKVQPTLLLSVGPQIDGGLSLDLSGRCVGAQSGSQGTIQSPTQVAAQSSPSGRARSRRQVARHVDPESDMARCPVLMTSCPIGEFVVATTSLTAQKRGVRSWECVNILEELTSCGSCGNDCTKIPNVGSVGCAAGSCKIFSCKNGLTPQVKIDAKTGKSVPSCRTPFLRV